MASRTKEAKGKNKRYTLLMSLLSVLIILGSIGLISIWRFVGRTTIKQGVFIDNIDVGGFNTTQAEDKVSTFNRKKLEDFSLTLNYLDNKWTFYSFDIKGKYNTNEVVEKAYSLGREGNLVSQIMDTAKLKKEPVALYTEFSFDTTELKEQLSKIKDIIDKAPKDAKIEFHPDAEKKFIIFPEETGMVLNADEVMDTIHQRLNDGNLKIDITLEPEIVAPKVLAEDFKGKTEVLITFGTDLSTSAADRTHNVVMAAQQFNGLVVPPGQVVSFNGTVGERTAAKGYRNAPMIKADKSLEDAVGGGVSQTSSTLYNAALRSGLEIVEYTRHSFPSAYIGKGLDTTVNLPSPIIDLKFRNNKQSPIYIRSFYANKKVYFEFFGEPLGDGKEIRIRTEEYETVPAPKPDYIEDTEGKYVKYLDQKFEKVKSREGYKVRLYREIYKGDTLIKSEFMDDHYYRPIKGKIYTGIEERPAQEPTTGDNSDSTDIRMNIVEIIDEGS